MCFRAIICRNYKTKIGERGQWVQEPSCQEPGSEDKWAPSQKSHGTPNMKYKLQEDPVEHKWPILSLSQKDWSKLVYSQSKQTNEQVSKQQTFLYFLVPNRKPGSWLLFLSPTRNVFWGFDDQMNECSQYCQNQGNDIHFSVLEPGCQFSCETGPLISCEALAPGSCTKREIKKCLGIQNSV